VDPYHEGSRAVQTRVGVREAADHVGRSIGSEIRDVAAAFLGLQPMLIIGAADETDRMWSSLLTGGPGFVKATGRRRISVAVGLPDSDPLAAALAAEGTAVGTIALDPRTRRRMRLNGTAEPTARGFVVEAEQVFSNCPKYLQKRELRTPVPARSSAVRRSRELTPDQESLIHTADTFFIATASADGADASHRGGNPGFVRVTSPNELSWQDYAGNSMFLTLGNLESDPRAGLLFLGWSTGTTLQLTGTAKTEFGAHGRTNRFTVAEVVETPHASPLRWSAPEYSPANPPLRESA